MNIEATLPNTLKHPSAFLPIVMSLLAVLVIVIHIVRFGPATQPDEGTSAHLWQLLMGLQIPIVAFFAVRWMPKSPRFSLLVLAFHALAAMAALAPVYLLHW